MMKRERKQTEGRQPPSLSQRSSLADSTDLVSFSRSGRTDVGLVAGRLERQLESGCPQLALTPSLSCPSLACLGARMRASTPLSATLARSRRRGVDWMCGRAGQEDRTCSIAVRSRPPSPTHHPSDPPSSPSPRKRTNRQLGLNTSLLGPPTRCGQLGRHQRAGDRCQRPEEPPIQPPPRSLTFRHLPFALVRVVRSRWLRSSTLSLFRPLIAADCPLTQPKQVFAAERTSHGPPRHSRPSCRVAPARSRPSASSSKPAGVLWNGRRILLVAQSSSAGFLRGGIGRGARSGMESAGVDDSLVEMLTFCPFAKVNPALVL